MKWYEPGLKILPAFLIFMIIAGASLMLYFLYLVVVVTVQNIGPYYGTAVILFAILAIYIFVSALYGLPDEADEKGYY